MCGQDFFNACFHIRVFVIGIHLNVQLIEVVVHKVVRTEILGFRIQEADKWWIRALPFCEMVIRIRKPHFLHQSFYFFVGHWFLLTLVPFR